MNVYLHKIYDYTFKRKGQIAYQIVDEDHNYVPMTGGFWKSRRGALEMISEMGLTLVGEYTTHQNYSHWQDFELAK